jgi:uncharacterized protein (UPF0332 family)
MWRLLLYRITGYHVKNYLQLWQYCQKTKDNGILKAIQDAYYKNGDSDKKIIGKIYKAVIEYRKTDIWTTPQSTEDTPVKTGKKKSMWMINSLSK